MNSKPKVIVKRIVAVLSLPKRHTELILKAKAIVQAMTGNANFPTPIPALTGVTANINALDAAETATQMRTIGTTDIRNVKLQAVMKDLRALTAYVQSIADANVANAEAIILSAGIDVKKSNNHPHPSFDVRNADVSGTVILIAGEGGAHEWQMSSDQIYWTMLPSTFQSKTKLEGLSRGATLYFRNKPILRNGNGAWSHIVDVVVT
jgi:energy-converting hydrogenase Eha subunit A